MSNCCATLEDMVKRLNGSGAGKLSMVLGKRLLWPFKETEVIAIIAQLERYKTSFNLVLSEDSV